MHFLSIPLAIALLAGLCPAAPVYAHEKGSLTHCEEKLTAPATLFEGHELLDAVHSLKIGNRPALLSAKALAELRRMAGVKNNAQLIRPEALNRLELQLHARIGEDQESHSKALVRKMENLMDSIRATEPYSLTPSYNDMVNGWGTALLPPDDKAFQDPNYLIDWVREGRGPSGAVANLEGKGKKSRHLMQDFRAAWAAIAPRGVTPIAYALTGSDANNMLYEIADRLVRFTNEPVYGTHAEILTFDGSYAAGRGKMRKLNGILEPLERDDYLAVVSPHTPFWDPQDPAEIDRLEKIEDAALKEIRKKVRAASPPIGGFLLESVLGAKGVYFYRPKFLLQLRALCDTLGIPIFADEILTGGGRTGTFFAYQHYEGFAPDFVTFGKGLEVAGIAEVNRRPYFQGLLPYQTVTRTHYAEPILKATQILKRIHDDHLMENATQVGEYFVRRLREMAGQQDARGIGLLIYSNKELVGIHSAETATRESFEGIGRNMNSSSHDGRFMPFLTLTREDVDEILSREQHSAPMTPASEYLIMPAQKPRP